MNVQDAVLNVSERLAVAGIEDARRESEFLVATLLNISPADLHRNRHQIMPDAARVPLSTWAQARADRKPLSYIAGEHPFRNIVLEVTPDVLIPRPETELVVESALKLLDGMNAAVTVVDVGTGSGNIAISLARHERVARCIGIDISEKALDLAQRNARTSGVWAKCEWFHGDLLEPLVTHSEPVHLVVANLPYVRSADLEGLEPELHWEPRVALDGGDTGLRLIDRCVHQAREVISAHGWLVLEIGYDQADQVSALLEQSGSWQRLRVLTDFGAIPRIVHAQRKGD